MFQMLSFLFDCSNVPCTQRNKLVFIATPTQQSSLFSQAERHLNLMRFRRNRFKSARDVIKQQITNRRQLVSQFCSQNIRMYTFRNETVRIFHAFRELQNFCAIFSERSAFHFVITNAFTPKPVTLVTTPGTEAAD